MSAAIWAWLSRLVVRLYPPRLRERYGEEVQGLLSRSASARDLADVAWCAAVERAGGVTFAGVCRSVLRLAALVALVPVATAAWMLLASAGAVVMAMVSGHSEATITLGYTLLPAVVLMPLAFLLSRRLAGRWPLPPVVVAACLAAGAFGSASIPGAGTLLGEVWAPSVAATGVWLAGMLVLLAMFGGRAARVPGVVTVLGMMMMAYVVLSAATAAFAVTLRTFEASMWVWSPLWYPIALTGGESMAYVQIWPAYDNTKLLPQVLTLLTFFVLAWRSRSQADAAASHSDLVAA